jgi:hypothetical protein
LTLADATGSVLAGLEGGGERGRWDFRSQISDLRYFRSQIFQISDISDLRYFRSQISDFRFQSSEFRVQKWGAIAA